MKECKECGVNETTLWRRDENERLLCNACGLKRYKVVKWPSRRLPAVKRNKDEIAQYKTEASRKRRRADGIRKLSLIISKVRNDDQKRQIIDILAKGCEVRVAKLLASGKEVEIEINVIRRTQWRRD